MRLLRRMYRCLRRGWTGCTNDQVRGERQRWRRGLCRDVMRFFVREFGRADNDGGAENNEYYGSLDTDPSNDNEI